MGFPQVPCLAYAEQTDLSGSQWILVLSLLGIFVAIGSLALGPVMLVARRRHRRVEEIATAFFFWALLAVWSGFAVAIAEFEWRKERLVLVESGYYDPRSNEGAPALPWATWAILAAAYAGLVGLALVGRSPPASTS
jgi:hypothetical protein